jgi:DNA-binding Lrp family transcriptional regulator
MVRTQVTEDGLTECIVDETDRRILKLVRGDANLSITALSKKLQMSKSATKYRLDRLTQTGTIKYVVLVDPTVYGLKLSVAFHLTVEPNALGKVAEKLVAYDEVTVVYAISNDCALIVHALFKDNNDLEHFMRHKLHIIKGIREAKCGTIIRRYKPGHTMIM